MPTGGCTVAELVRKCPEPSTGIVVITAPVPTTIAIVVNALQKFAGRTSLLQQCFLG